MSIISLLSQDSYLIINKTLLKHLEGDLNQTLMLTELITLAYLFKNSEQMKNHDGWFFRSVEDVEKDILLNDYKQRLAIVGLEKKGLINCKRAGRPAKRFFKLNESKIEEIINNTCFTPSSCREEETSKKDKQSAFYNTINEAISTEDFDSYKTSIGNIRKVFAAFMYTWSRLYRKCYDRDWRWTPIRFGQLSSWFKTHIEHPGKTLDYSILNSFFEEPKNTDFIIEEWKKFYNSTPEKFEKVFNPAIYW